MPKISKAEKITYPRTSRKKADMKTFDKVDQFVCTRCGKVFPYQKTYFPASQSQLYRGWGGYIPVCYTCMESLYDYYVDVLGSEEAAIERLCMKFDIYWHTDLYNMLNKNSAKMTRIKMYISKTFLIKWHGKTYDDTLDEKNGSKGPIEFREVMDEDYKASMEASNFQPRDIDTDSFLFWGPGFDESTYKELGMRYDNWTQDLPKPLSRVDEALYKQICIQEVNINRNIAAGKDIEKGQTALNNLLGSLNIKPNQKKEKEEADADLETTPLGVWARRWEENRPIPDDEDIPEPKLIKYITAWLFGHLGKAFGLRNVYTKLYDEEMERYRVQKPEFIGEDDDEVLVDLFGDGITGDNGGGDGG